MNWNCLTGQNSANVTSAKAAHTTGVLQPAARNLAVAGEVGLDSKRFNGLKMSESLAIRPLLKRPLGNQGEVKPPLKHSARLGLFFTAPQDFFHLVRVVQRNGRQLAR